MSIDIFRLGFLYFLCNMTDKNCTKVIGIVADIRRDAENDYGSEKCNVFGLVEEEYDALTKIAVLTPKKYSFEKCDRITVSCRLISFKFLILPKDCSTSLRSCFPTFGIGI
jgi:hypothetical protein